MSTIVMGMAPSVKIAGAANTGCGWGGVQYIHHSGCCFARILDDAIMLFRNKMIADDYAVFDALLKRIKRVVECYDD